MRRSDDDLPRWAWLLAGALTLVGLADLVLQASRLGF